MKDALALALVHFLWQGAVLGALGWGLMRLGRSASVRYTIGVATLAAMLAAPIVTFAVLAPRTPSTSTSSSAPLTLTERVSGTTVASAPAAGAFAMPALPTTWILAIWIIGVCALSARVAGGWLVARRLAATGIAPISAELQDMATTMADRLAVRRVVRVLVSSRAAVPVMIGWWQPIVLMPASAISGMSLAQIEALLAHEFAHIRRHDYLVNLLQTFVETVCFYHPAVWWLSREVRRERERCCDDIAVAVCDRVTYVTALARVAEITAPQLVMAASGGSLRDRVRRLIAPEFSTSSAKSGWTALLTVVLVVLIAGSNALGSPTPTQATPTRPASGRKISVADLRRLLESDRQTLNALTTQWRTLQIETTASQQRGQSERDLAQLKAAISALEEQVTIVQARVTKYEDQLQAMAGVSLVVPSTLLPRDVVTIVISGEPLLPRDYEVRKDGSIRFPLLGVIEVEGLSPADLQAQITRLLVDKGLGSNPSVRVSALRPR